MHANFKDFRKRSPYYVPGVSLVKTRQEMRMIWEIILIWIETCHQVLGKLSTKASKSTPFNSITNNLILKQLSSRRFGENVKVLFCNYLLPDAPPKKHPPTQNQNNMLLLWCWSNTNTTIILVLWKTEQQSALENNTKQVKTLDSQQIIQQI